MPDEAAHEATAPLVAAAEAAIKRAHAENVAHSTAARDESLTQWLEAFEAEHAGVLQRVLTGVLAHPDMPTVFRDVLGGISNPVHQTQVLLGLVSVGSIVSQFVGAAIAPEVQAVSNVAWSANPDAPLPPAEVALAVLKGWLDEGSAQKEAELSGVNASRFATMLKITGEPPGPQELMEALRRGYIDRDRFATGIKESRIRPEWLDVLYKLRISPLPMGTAVAAAVEGHITLGELANRLNQVGLDPADAELIYNTAGRPPGTFELAELVNRGELSEADLIQAVRESDIKNKYIPSLIKLRRKIPPMRSIVAAMHQGVLSPADGVRKLMQLGYNAEDAAIFAKEAANLKHATNKQLSLGMIHTAYTQRLITKAQAQKLIAALGYDANEVGFILALADHERHVKFQQAAITRVHSRYVAHRITRADAVAAIGKIGVDPAGRDDLLALWDDERAANTPVLSLSQLDGMIHRGVITQAVYQNHVLALGYPKEYVPLLYALAWPPTKKPPEWKL